MKGGVFVNDVIAAIDIGTTKICVLIARPNGLDSCDIIGFGKAPSCGLRKGVVVDIAKTVEAIKYAVAEAELMAGCTIDSACIGISGSHIRSYSSQGIVPIKHGEVSQKDIDNVVASARALALPDEYHILHVLPQYFSVDSHERVSDPRGMFGVRLEAKVHIITGAIASVQNLIKCCELAGIRVTDIVLEQLASALAVLNADERHVGVGLLDIGGGTSDLAVYYNNSIIFTKVFSVAGTQFTNDLAIGLHTTLQEAERIKKEYGCVWKNDSYVNKELLVQSIQGDEQHSVELENVTNVLTARAQELLNLTFHSLEKEMILPYLNAGFVITGGGSMLKGLPQLASHTLKVPSRVGKPRSEGILVESLGNPMYATPYGLLLHALKKRDTSTIPMLSGNTLSRIVMRMKSWVSEFF